MRNLTASEYDLLFIIKHTDVLSGDCNPECHKSRWIYDQEIISSLEKRGYIIRNIPCQYTDYIHSSITATGLQALRIYEFVSFTVSY